MTSALAGELFPGGERFAGQARIEIARIVAHFAIDPVGKLNLFLGIFQLDFGDRQSLICAAEFIDLPRMPLVQDSVAGLFDWRMLAQVVEDLVRVLQGYLVLVFVASDV